MIIAIIIATALGILDAAVLGHAHRTSEPRHALHAGVVDAPDAFDGAGIVLEMNLRRSNIKGSVNEIVGDVVGKKSPGLVDMGSVGVGLWIQGSNQVDAIVIEGGIMTLMLHVELSDECEDWFDDSWSLEFNLDDDGCMLVEFEHLSEGWYLRSENLFGRTSEFAVVWIELELFNFLPCEIHDAATWQIQAVVSNISRKGFTAVKDKELIVNVNIFVVASIVYSENV
jgi:hypothetical protein